MTNTIEKTELRPLIIGAGGVASYMLPVLLRQFTVRHGVLIDADVLEARNLDRQVFKQEHVGHNKATALLQTCEVDMLDDIEDYGYVRMVSLEEWFTKDCLEKVTSEYPFIEEKDFNIIICLVDNNPTRKEIFELSDKLNIPTLVCANEIFESQAYFYVPERHNKDKAELAKFDPRVRYPEIVEDQGDDPRNPNCQTTQEAYPQLASSNMMAAALGMQLLNQWIGPDTKPKPDFPFRTLDVLTGRGVRSLLKTEYSLITADQAQKQSTETTHA